MPDLEHRQVPFTALVGEYQGLKVFKPELPGDDWFYLGPAAVNDDDDPEKRGLIVRANDSSALGDIADWEQVFVDIERRQFSVWRPIPANPDEYASGGDVFVHGTDKPTSEQAAGLKVIRKDLIGERQPQHIIKEIRLPKAIVVFWDIVVTDLLHIPTGAFRATGSMDVEGLVIPVVRFNAW